MSNERRYNDDVGYSETYVLNAEYANDLTDHTVTLVVETPNGESLGEYEADVDENNVYVRVDPTDRGWPVGKVKYFLIATDPDGIAEWLLFGTLTVLGAANV